MNNSHETSEGELYPNEDGEIQGNYNPHYPRINVGNAHSRGIMDDGSDTSEDNDNLHLAMRSNQE
jgi:hypothetical protein